MIRRPPRSTQSRSSAASDVYKRQLLYLSGQQTPVDELEDCSLWQKCRCDVRVLSGLAKTVHVLLGAEREANAQAGRQQLAETAQLDGAMRDQGLDRGNVVTGISQATVRGVLEDEHVILLCQGGEGPALGLRHRGTRRVLEIADDILSLIHISEPTRLGMIS